jgi:hypothetical protein
MRFFENVMKMNGEHLPSGTIPSDFLEISPF